MEELKRDTDERSPNRVFITGTSSGLGRGLQDVCLRQGWHVYGLSRREPEQDHSRLRHVRCDLADLDSIPAALDALLGEADGLDLVFLNAGILGRLRVMPEVPLEDLRSMMDVNVWSNKVIFDWLHAKVPDLRQVVAISSGAAVLGSRGWDGYSLSKAALNMLVRLYSHEFPGAHLCALAPGLIDSEMMDYLCLEVDPEAFPAVQRFRQVRGTDKMPGPYEAAERVLSVLPELLSYPSGDYVDIRQILDPEEYEKLYRG